MLLYIILALFVIFGLLAIFAALAAGMNKRPTINAPIVQPLALVEVTHNPAEVSDFGTVSDVCDCADCREYRYNRYHNSNQFGR